MGILEEILQTQKDILAVLAGGTSAKTTTDKPATTKPATAKGPTLEAVQDQIRALAEIDGNKDKIKALITALGAKRAGDLEGDAAKLKKLSDGLTALAADTSDDATTEEDDDLL